MKCPLLLHINPKAEYGHICRKYAVKNQNRITILCRIPCDVTLSEAKGLRFFTKVDLADAVLVLKIMARSTIPSTQTINLAADVNGDGKIGLAEVVYILRNAAQN
ncbi:MAG: hypothetical protein BWK80_06585 [Desulfobacteraceae bacterium IS3]|nr:MAG: hypothetical protein BWK80_06585 [Desulfobacteraceae bacterium IS3]